MKNNNSGFLRDIMYYVPSTLMNSKGYLYIIIYSHFKRHLIRKQIDECSYFDITLYSYYSKYIIINRTVRARSVQCFDVKRM